MNLYSLMQKRAEESGPIGVGVIGAGKFASMFLTQAVGSEHIQAVGVADIDVPKARNALQRTGWPVKRYSASSFGEVLWNGSPTFDATEGKLQHAAT